MIVPRPRSRRTEGRCVSGWEGQDHSTPKLQRFVAYATVRQTEITDDGLPSPPEITMLESSHRASANLKGWCLGVPCGFRCNNPSRHRDESAVR